MISILYGSKGTGKSRRLISRANREHTSKEENSVFIDNDDDRMYLLVRGIRYINAGEYGIDGPKMFTGFLCGIAAQDFDLQAIYINSFDKIVNHPLITLKGMFAFLEKFSSERNLDLYISISGDGELPEFLKKYAI